MRKAEENIQKINPKYFLPLKNEEKEPDKSKREEKDFLEMYQLPNVEADLNASFLRYHHSINTYHANLKKFLNNGGKIPPTNELSKNISKYKEMLISPPIVTDIIAMAKEALLSDDFTKLKEIRKEVEFLLIEDKKTTETEKTKLKKALGEIIISNLNNKQPETHSFFADIMRVMSFDIDNMENIFKYGLEQENAKIFQKYVNIFNLLPTEKKVELIKKGLKNNNFNIRERYAYLIRFWMEDKKRAMLVKQGLDQENSEVQEICSKNIKKIKSKWKKFILSRKVSKLIKSGLSGNNVSQQAIYASMIESSWSGNKATLIKECLSKSPLVQLKCMGSLSKIPDDLKAKIPSILEKVFDLQSYDIEAQKYSVNFSRLLSPEKKVYFIKKGLASQDEEVKEKWASLITETEPLEMAELINIGLDTNNQGVRKTCLSMIRFVPDSEKESLIEKGLKKNNIPILEFAELVGFNGELEREAMFKLLTENGLGEQLIAPKLYNDSNVSNKSLDRKKFKKTGSETTLIGGTLKGRVIIRRLRPQHFEIWRKLYENYKIWEDNGFDYVPIEPIISCKLNKSGLVDVFAGVLDLSFGRWLHMTTKFANELEEQKLKIEKILNDLGIDHGHTHRQNFCLKFFHDKDGNIDFNKMPRIYLIDFDQAKKMLTNTKN